MTRRELMMVGAATAVAGSVFTTSETKAKRGKKGAAAAPATPSEAFAETVSGCISAGEVCLSHCLRLLAEGDKSMGACAKSVREMLAVCRAAETLVLADSKHLAALAAVCGDVCDDCRAECEKHAAHHPECRACGDACAKTAAAARALAV